MKYQIPEAYDIYKNEQKVANGLSRGEVGQYMTDIMKSELMKILPHDESNGTTADSFGYNIANSEELDGQYFEFSNVYYKIRREE